MTDKEYLEFSEKELDPKRKTKEFRIWNKTTEDYLGDIAWHCGWRQYCFYPEDRSWFARSCLIELKEFIDKLMIDRELKKLK